MASRLTIIHHHAVGRDHRPWYEKLRPALFGDALARAKSHLDPTGISQPRRASVKNRMINRALLQEVIK